ncbi:Peptidase C2 calpain large subunit domain III [Trinorchestia longiramus]|nr:Peptidase C2 calpain large subunit domain III [Trinorchestia longiramus]
MAGWGNTSGGGYQNLYGGGMTQSGLAGNAAPSGHNPNWPQGSYGGNTAPSGHDPNWPQGSYGGNTVQSGHDPNWPQGSYGGNVAPSGYDPNWPQGSYGGNAAPSGYDPNWPQGSYSGNAAPSGYDPNWPQGSYGGNAAPSGFGGSAPATVLPEAQRQNSASSNNYSIGFMKPPDSKESSPVPQPNPNLDYNRVGSDYVGFAPLATNSLVSKEDEILDLIENLPTGDTRSGAGGSANGRNQSRSSSEQIIKRYRNVKHGRQVLSKFQCLFKGIDGNYHHIKPFGERGSGLHGRGEEIQDFERIRDYCLESGVLFEDPSFPAEDISIFFSKSPPKPFEWKRPHEISSDPQLFVDGASRFDVKQGELGDCWLLAAVANLTLNRRLFYQIVPSDQSFGDNYAGVFHFRFWQYGRWVDVVIDDRLPTYYGKLVFMHSAERNEYWSALLEKAYAKLHGSYEALKGGTTCEAMEDFTGGVSELYDLTKAPPTLFQIMLKSYERGSLMGCSLEPDPNEVEARCSNGLVRGHAYSITCVKYCEIQTPRVSGKIPLVRIRNPWGNEAEWNGPWSDQSEEWQFIPQEEKEEMGLTFEHDGEFWMAYKSFWHNPQYRITLTEVDDDDMDNKCTVIVALMQKNRRSQRKLGLECLTIGFAIYHLRDPDSLPRPLDMNFFKYNASAARSPSFINMREVSCRFKLPPGTYCIVPSTFEPHEEGEFLLRVFSEKTNVMEENDGDVGFGQVDDRVKPASEEEAAEQDDRIRGFFSKVAGEDLEIDWSELQSVLNYAMKREFEFDGFSKDICRSMISMMDVDRSGKLGLREFIRLWTDIRTWKNCFKLYDKDNSSKLSGFELRAALTSAGYRLNNHISDALMLRYGDKEGNVSFDDYIMCSVKLRTMMGESSSRGRRLEAQRARQHNFLFSKEVPSQKRLLCCCIFYDTAIIGLPGETEAPTEEDIEEFYNSLLAETQELQGQRQMPAEDEEQQEEE